MEIHTQNTPMMRIGLMMDFIPGVTLLLINTIGIEVQEVLNLDSPLLKTVKSFLIQLIGSLVFTILGKK
mgnify:CR=1 FL=1